MSTRSAKRQVRVSFGVPEVQNIKLEDILEYQKYITSSKRIFGVTEGQNIELEDF